MEIDETKKLRQRIEAFARDPARLKQCLAFLLIATQRDHPIETGMQCAVEYALLEFHGLPLADLGQN